MTENKTIEQMNRVIAGFCCDKYWPKRRSIFVKYSDAYEFRYNGKSGIAFGPEHLKYHSDWSWLHQAWSKVLKKSGAIPSFIWSPEIYAPMSRAMITGNLTSAHKILYEAINFLKQLS